MRAFPSPYNHLSGVIEPGMDLRDYFAAVALQTACKDYGPQEAAKLAYQFADAMLEARKS